jgi:hypothetical protein
MVVLFRSLANPNDLRAFRAVTGSLARPRPRPKLVTNNIPILVNLFLATTTIQCWPYILGFSVWATAICLICQYVKNISFSATLLTVLGTVLGFVISYRVSIYANHIAWSLRRTNHLGRRPLPLNGIMKDAVIGRPLFSMRVPFLAPFGSMCPVSPLPKKSRYSFNPIVRNSGCCRS